jgi:imidazolonepropionase-like amidohydrolase
VLKTLFLMVALAMPTRPARADELLIRGAILVDGLGAGPRPSVDILIRNGRIHAIEPRGSIEARGTVIEAAGMIALPGLIDAHVHFVAAPGTGYRNDSDETIAELNRHHLRAYLACGVTTVLDAGSFPAVAREIKSWLAAGNPGPRYLTTGPYVRPPDGWGHPRFGAESTAAEVEAKLDLIEDLGGVGVKIGIERGLAFFGGPRPHPPDVLDAVVRGARRRGLPLYVHAMTEDTQAEALRLGAHAIMHAALNFQAPKELSPEFVAEIKASGAYQLTTLSIVDTFPGVYDVRRLDDPIIRLVVPSIELETARAPAAREYFLSALIGTGAPWTFRWTRPYLAWISTEGNSANILPR